MHYLYLTWCAMTHLTTFGWAKTSSGHKMYWYLIVKTF